MKCQEMLRRETSNLKKNHILIKIPMRIPRIINRVVSLESAQLEAYIYLY